MVRFQRACSVLTKQEEGRSNALPEAPWEKGGFIYSVENTNQLMNFPNRANASQADMPDSDRGGGDWL